MVIIIASHTHYRFDGNLEVLSKLTARVEKSEMPMATGIYNINI